MKNETGLDRYFRWSWFQEPGAYVLVDGQFGSTGKGLLAAYLSQFAAGKVNKITTNAGPNSGHTAYFDPADYDVRPRKLSPEGMGGHDPIMVGRAGSLMEKVVTQQLPMMSVFLDKIGQTADTIINAGAIIDYGIMMDELGKWCNQAGSRVLIHPNAALITNRDREEDQSTVAAIAGTGKGTGPALAMKLLRTGGKDAVASAMFAPFLPEGYKSWDNLWDWKKDVVFVETAQGFSLGLNSARFYPHVTSRECTVQQALADARIPAQVLQKVVATFRTYPIRVGNTTGSSGDCYPDQEETSWEALGIAPELTTVTKRVRRVFTWSDTQFQECVATNRPDVIFLNMANYCKDDVQLTWYIHRMTVMYQEIMGKRPEAFLLGFGPRCDQITSVNEFFNG